MNFSSVVNLIRDTSLSERETGERFERLIQKWFCADPLYASQVDKVWLWEEFPSKSDFGTKDLGIDLVVRTEEGGYWAIQCKCYAPNTTIDKAAIDSFISNSSRTFTDPVHNIKTSFSARFWISTTETWNRNADERKMSMETLMAV